MGFTILKNNGCGSGSPGVTVYDANGIIKRLSACGGGPTPPIPVAWGDITGIVTNQTDLIDYLDLNFYPLSSNPAGYLTDAPSDGSTYGRRNGAWSVVSGSVTPAALTKTDDTNVTLTLGGTPATALLQATSLTLGWTGTLATGRGGTGLSTIGTSLQYLRVDSGGTALEYATFPTVNTYTVDNGLTENPAGNFQLGGALTGYTQIDGASNTYAIDFLDLTTFGVATSERISLLSIATGSVTSYFDLYPASIYTKWGYDDGAGNITEIEMDGAKMFIRTPGYASASNGDVLTLISNASGQVEFQTPGTTTGDSLSPLLLMGG